MAVGHRRLTPGSMGRGGCGSLSGRGGGYHRRPTLVADPRTAAARWWLWRGEVFKNDTRASRSARAPRIAVFDELFEATFKGAQLFQFAAHFTEMRLSKIPCRNAIPVRGADKRYELANLLDGKSEIAATTNES